MFPELKKHLDHYLELGVPGFDIIIYQDGRLLWRYQNGYADLENRIPFGTQERVNIYSCSKPITVTAALQLVERGDVKLDAPLCDYLPEFAHMNVKTPGGVRRAETRIRVVDLFAMQAGFHYDVNAPALLRAREELQGRCPTRELMKYLAQEPLDFDPGTGWQYSLGHDVLAAVVEVVSGQRFEAYVKEHIFDPLGMKRTTFLLPQDERASLTPQYSYETGGAVDIGTGNAFLFGTEYASGGAGCVSTAEDYILFLEALRKGDIILGGDTIRLMTTDRLHESMRPAYGLTPQYGYGLGVRCPCAGSDRTDFGWDGAAGSYLAVDPALNVSVFHCQHMRYPPNHYPNYDIPVILKKELERA